MADHSAPLSADVGGDGAPAEPLAWPSALKDRAQAVRAVMHHADAPLTVEQVARHFHRARRRDVRSLLDTLEALGHVEQTDDGAYAANPVRPALISTCLPRPASVYPRPPLASSRA